MSSCCSGDGTVAQINPAPAQKNESLTMTKEAAAFVADLMKKERKEGWGLRIEVAPGGCAGYKYFMSFKEKPQLDDKTLEFHGIKIFLDLMSFSLIKGSAIEFVSALEGTGIKINNPNMTRACGCGKSFG